MIVAIACVPQAPLLLPGLTGGPVPEVEQVRTAARDAVATLWRHDVQEVVVVGAAPATKPYPVQAPSPAGNLAPGPGRRPAPSALPVSLAVGRSVLGECPVPMSLEGIRENASVQACRRLGRRLAMRSGRIGLVVAADGGARRGVKAPGYIDPRAAALDARIAEALDAAGTDALLALDPRACADLMIAGRAAWQVMAAACQSVAWRSRTLYRDDPFGVAYHVLTWTPRRSKTPSV